MTAWNNEALGLGKALWLLGGEAMLSYYFCISEFEVNVVIVLQDDHLITENFPIKVIRC